MKIFLAGVPGGGKMGNCKRERAVTVISPSVMELPLLK